MENTQAAQQSHRLLFTLAAVFNWVIGLGLFFDARMTLGLIGVTTLPTEFTFVRIVGGLVFLFGFWYYRAGSDLRGVASAIWLGAIAKVLVFSVALFDGFTGQMSWQFMIPASADLAFALLFFRALNEVRRESG